MIFTTNMSIFLFFLLACCKIASAQRCPELSPCNCQQFNSDLYVICVEETMEDIKSVFTNLTSPINIYQLNLYIQDTGDNIPADLLGQSQVINALSLQRRPFGTTYLPLTIDPNAFRSSKTSLQSIEMKYLDASLLNLNFLEGFQNLRELEFNFDINLDQSIRTFPALPGLTILSFYNSTGLNNAFQSGALQSRGLTTLDAFNCDLIDDGMAQLLNWILPSSTLTLEELSIDSNRFGTIPRQIGSFDKLKTISIDDNIVDLAIPRNSFNIGVGNSSISISSSRVVNVESGAFQGDYSSSIVSLTNNLLTRIEEGIFKSMLQDMSNGEGFVDLNQNPFDCLTDPCHLAWLLRDNRNLLNKVKNAQCEDGTIIEDLNPILFEECP